MRASSGGRHLSRYTQGMDARPLTSVGRGRLGEAIAALYLEMNGYRVLARNLRSGPLEIDLVAARDAVVAVVEVRLRSSARHGSPEESVRPSKRAHLTQAALRAAPDLRLPPAARLRFDVIALEREAFGLRLRHLQGLWRLPAR